MRMISFTKRETFDFFHFYVILNYAASDVSLLYAFYVV